MKKHHINLRTRRHKRIRTKIFGSFEIPRLSVYRSQKHLFVQLINDEKRITLLGINDKNIGEKQKITKAKVLGKLIAEKALQIPITKVVFDRSGYAYHGRVKALAEGLREGGLNF